MAQAAEIHFIKVFMVDLHTHFTFGSICLRVSQTTFSNCTYGDNRVSTKIGKSCQYRV